METPWSNAILLCKGRCQEAYENVLDPGLIFVPTDLRYFIEYEKEMFEGPYTQAAETGISEERFFPTEYTYYLHQSDQEGLLSDDDSWGLYRAIYLRTDFLPRVLPSNKIVEPTIFTTPLAQLNSNAVAKSWHGEPIAAIRRAIMALGSMRVDAIPRQILDELRELQGLYCRKTEAKSVQRVVVDGQSVNARRW